MGLLRFRWPLLTGKGESGWGNLKRESEWVCWSLRGRGESWWRRLRGRGESGWWSLLIDESSRKAEDLIQSI